MAALSRLVAGVFDQTILVTLPGSTRAVSQCIPVILPVMKHAIHQIKGWDHLVRQEHPCHYVQSDGKSENVSISTTPTIVDRCRQSKHPTITVDEALEKIYTVANPTMEVEAVFHKNALGRVLGRSLRARQCIPPFDASIMDGYAIRFEDSTGQLRVIGALCAGDTNFISKQLTLTPGTCVRVNTGGPIPFGADCVVPVENTRLISRRIGGPDEYDEEEDIIELIVAPEKVGQFIRPTGFDLNKNDIFRKGLRLGPAELGLISGAGLLTPWPADYANLIEERGDPLPDTVLSYLMQGGYIPCLKQYRIGVLSTGNEILDSFVSENESCVRDSNRPVLINLLRQHNYYNVVDFGIRQTIKSL
ncbi:unnamed protein product [Heterobilharzia americana]|nr:unnamed protein product [Heterobilharzia americana]